MLDKVFILRLSPETSLATTSLTGVRRHGRTLDVAGIGDRDRSDSKSDRWSATELPHAAIFESLILEQASQGGCGWNSMTRFWQKSFDLDEFIRNDLT